MNFAGVQKPGGTVAKWSLPSHTHAQKPQSPGKVGSQQTVTSTSLGWSPAVRESARESHQKHPFTVMGLTGFLRVYLEDLATHSRPDALYLVLKNHPYMISLLYSYAFGWERYSCLGTRSELPGNFQILMIWPYSRSHVLSLGCGLDLFIFR